MNAICPRVSGECGCRVRFSIDCHLLRSCERLRRVEPLLAQQAADHGAGPADPTPAMQVERLAGTERPVDHIECHAHQGRRRHVEVGDREPVVENANAPCRGVLEEERNEGCGPLVLRGEIDQMPYAGSRSASTLAMPAAATMAPGCSPASSCPGITQ